MPDEILQPKYPDQLSQAMGELSNYRATQNEFNARLLASLAKIEERLSSLGEVNAILKTYRGTLHERFNHVHKDLSNMDLELEKLTIKVNALEDRRMDINDKINTRLMALETGITSINFGLKIVYGLASLTGPVLVYFIPFVIKLMTTGH